MSGFTGRLKDWGSMLWDAGERFIAQGAMRFSAALAFYSVLSLAPLVLFFISLTSLLLQDGQNQAILVDQLDILLGSRGMEIVRQVLEDVPELSEGLVGMAWSLGLLLFGGSVLFVNVRATLNAVWDVRVEEDNPITAFLRGRLVAIGMIFATGAVLVASTLLGAVANWILPIVRSDLPVGDTLVMVAELALSGGLLTLFCATTWRILPDVEIEWRDLWMGAAITAGLFLVGRAAMGWYLSHGAGASEFGAAGSLFAFLIWVYYSACIFFFGAEFTQVWAERRGRPIQSAEGAVAIRVEEVREG